MRYLILLIGLLLLSIKTLAFPDNTIQFSQYYAQIKIDLENKNYQGVIVPYRKLTKITLTYTQRTQLRKLLDQMPEDRRLLYTFECEDLKKKCDLSYLDDLESNLNITIHGKEKKWIINKLKNKWMLPSQEKSYKNKYNLFNMFEDLNFTLEEKQDVVNYILNFYFNFLFVKAKIYFKKHENQNAENFQMFKDQLAATDKLMVAKSFQSYMSLISDELVSESLKEVKLFIKEWSDNNTWVEVALNDLLLLHLYY